MLTLPRPAAITDSERRQRLDQLRSAMEREGLSALLLGSTASLRYFTGLSWHPSERLLGALVTAETLTYIAPGFEVSRVESLPHLSGEIRAWQEDENPATLVRELARPSGRLALDDALPLSAYHALAAAFGSERLVDASPLLRGLRLTKSPAEIALLAYGIAVTLEVQRRAHRLMAPGIRASEVVHFIDEQHRELAGSPSTFCIVSFGAATALPHGAEGDQVLEPDDPILVDTGTEIDGYQSDLTRTYVLDDPTPDFERIWTIERQAQQAVFEAAHLGAPASALDDAARAVLSAHGLGPDYQLPGLPHRAGHGLGLEIHESPFIVRGNAQPLRQGMCFSNEPMIVVPGRFGVRLEDAMHMTEEGPCWFTSPAKSPTEPFA
ncbi:M24 family metallopeptidase [Consotaella salsifontis]|uniref:Xaa-Pro dipeptidase n=1 Tax=Consotaella salsifontis TaxID=1365950 RepID=A0A1T4MIR7_9HYPH|nr:Xaa-Pro peptidase family protein [Consotaella salsifontis]SJZ66761.1 Xaa-Pro dipeptidase [Consotaella salsifontis]